MSDSNVLPVHSDENTLDPCRWVALAVVLGALFLVVLDFLIVNIALPAMQADLRATSAQLQLVVAGYGLAYAVCLITGGRLGDIHGRRRMFLWGVAAFTLASLLCGLAPSASLLIAARVLQGGTAALMVPQIFSLVQVSFPPHERARAFAILGIVVGIASFIGNVLGGYLVSANFAGLTWRPIFFVNLPVGILSLLLAPRFVPESRAPHAHKLDLIGVALVSLGLFLLIFPMAEGREAGWPWWAWLCVGLSFVILRGFFLFEARLMQNGGAPLVDLNLFHDRNFVAGLGCMMTTFMGMSSFALMLTMFLQDGMGLLPKEAGLCFAPLSLSFLCASLFALRYADQLGTLLLLAGVGIMIVGASWLIFLMQTQGVGFSPRQLIAPISIYGFGQGLLVPQLSGVVLRGVSPKLAGTASGVLTTGQQVAGSLGIALIGSVFFTLLGPKPEPARFAYAFSHTFACNMVLMILTFVLLLRLPRFGPKPEVVAEAI
jgi:EmrB/QacA subfamily drug resistance transporter